MIKFKRVTYKNLLATGNHPISIDLNETKNTLIIGKNGRGKSTVLSAITLALFGKDFRGINKPKLVNSINKKGLEVEIEFETKGRNYVIKRGILPTLFEVYTDGELVNQTAYAKDYQRYIEENILKLNFNSFKQIVMLGANNFTPFMRLPAASRREIIEDLLDLTVFSRMNSILKIRIQETKDHISEIEKDIEIELEKLSLVSDHIRRIFHSKKIKTDAFKEEIQTHVNLIKQKEVEIVKQKDIIEQLKNKITEAETVSNRKKVAENQIFLTLKEISDLDRKIYFLEHNAICPTCERTIDEEFKQPEIEKLIQSKNSQLEKKASIEPKMKKFELISSKIENMYRHLQDVEKQLGDLESSVYVDKKYIEKLKSQNDTEIETDVTELKSKYDTIKASVERLKLLRQEQINKKELESVAFTLLKDSGIKTKIIKSYIPYINQLINTYLDAMNFYVSFNLDENFNEIIRSRHRDVFSYENFSEGEKQRIDLAILFAWREVAKKKNSMSTNILFLDEVADSSMDGGGVDDLVKILSTLENTNVFVISHKSSMMDSFDRVIEFQKVDNFSVIKETT